jgi:membrane protease YdiL (CAAX protease family)
LSFGLGPAEDAPPRHFPGPVTAFALTIGSVFAAVFATRLVMLLFDVRPSLSSLGVGEALGVGLVATFAAGRVAEPQRERLGLRGFDPSFIPWLVMLLPTIVVLSELENILRAFVPPPEIPEAMERLQEEFMGTGALAMFETAVVAVGISPVVEEWLFRGVIQQGLVAQLARARGVILTAGLYAIVHVGPAPSAPATLSPFLHSFLLGVVLGAVRLATGSVLAPILLSAGVSALGLIALGTADIFPIEGLSATGSHTSLTLLLPCLAGVAWALHGVIQQARSVPVALPLPGEEPEDAPERER